MSFHNRGARIKGYNSQVCLQDHKHDSRAEASYCNKLAIMLKDGEIKSYKSQVTYDLKVNGKKICGHRPDFEVEHLDGSLEIHEVKGFATAVWVLKHKLFEACYPDIPYKVIDARRMY